MKVKVGDNVRILAGKDKGKEGRVIRTLKKDNKVIVEGINMVKKHMKPNRMNEVGSIVDIEAPIHVSNVKLVESKKEAKKEAERMLDGKFTLDDLLKNMKRIQRMGSLGGLLKLIPGMPTITDEQKEAGEREMKTFEALINSMTPEERRNPEILKNSRKIRIAKGSGKTNADINRLVKKYEQMQEMMKRMQQYKKTGRMPPGGLGLPGMGGGLM